jgi:hypothetical protein
MPELRILGFTVDPWGVEWILSRPVYCLDLYGLLVRELALL